MVFCFYALIIFLVLPFASFLIYSGSIAIYGVKKVSFFHVEMILWVIFQEQISFAETLRVHAVGADCVRTVDNLCHAHTVQNCNRWRRQRWNSFAEKPVNYPHHAAHIFLWCGVRNVSRISVGGQWNYWTEKIGGRGNNLRVLRTIKIVTSCYVLLECEVAHLRIIYYQFLSNSIQQTKKWINKLEDYEPYFLVLKNVISCEKTDENVCWNILTKF